MMRIEHIPEPLVEFGEDFLCDDPKTGIGTAGFFSKSHNSHRSEIQFAVIGSKQHIQDTIDFIGRLSERIEATGKVIALEDAVEIEDGIIMDLFDAEANAEQEQVTVELNKKFNPDFPGLSKTGMIGCEFQNDSANNIAIKSKDIEAVLKEKVTLLEKVDRIIEWYVEAYQDMYENFTARPDVCFMILPDKVFNKLGSIQRGKSFVNLRRKLKAAVMALPQSDIPVQIALEGTVRGTNKKMQDLSMVAWNFVVAQYYKTANCIPWALTDVDKNSCFIGISFHKLQEAENSTMRSSIAQAFNREGKGLVFTGKQFDWNSAKTKVTAPHLQYDYAKGLIQHVLRGYVKINKHTPSRIVLHKTTDFWDTAINPDYAEVEGLTDGIREVLGDAVEIDFVTIKSAPVKLLRLGGDYPVIRGTLLVKNDYHGVLYTTGYIPFMEGYPGVHIPLGISVSTIGETPLREICREILALTKLNFNNCNYYDSLPITLRFSQKVGEIIQYLPEHVEPPNKYYYYM